MCNKILLNNMHIVYTCGYYIRCKGKSGKIGSYVDFSLDEKAF